MKATIEIPDNLYRRVKSKSALEGHTVREVAIQLFSQWADGVTSAAPAGVSEKQAPLKKSVPVWFGRVNRYAKKAQGGHTIETVRESISRGIAREGSL